MRLFAINSGEPVILQHNSVEQPGDEITMQGQVNEICSDWSHIPQHPQVNCRYVNEWYESCLEKFFLINVTLVDLDDRMARVAA